MNEKMTKFYEAVSADEALKEELLEVTSGVAINAEDTSRAAMADAVAAFAAAHDLDLTAADVLAADSEAMEGELTDEELMAVSGGGCGCIVIGIAKGCGCFVYGQSQKKDMGGLDPSYVSGKCGVVGL